MVRGRRSDGSCQTNLIFVGQTSRQKKYKNRAHFRRRQMAYKNHVGLTRAITACATVNQSMSKLAGLISETYSVGGERVCLAECLVAKVIGGRVV